MKGYKFLGYSTEGPLETILFEIPTVITHDVLEMRLPQPVPADKALEVAKEHYAFTPDRADQGTETYTLSEVAASIAVSSGWFFWWN